jgi:hypothetical protein
MIEGGFRWHCRNKLTMNIYVGVDVIINRGLSGKYLLGMG